MLSQPRTGLSEPSRILLDALLIAIAAICVLIVTELVPADRAGEVFSRLLAFLDAHAGAISALAGIAVAGFTWTLYKATTKQGDLTKEALVISTRAFVFLEDFENSLSTQYDRGGPQRVSAFSFAPKWKNSGETPTRKLSLFITCRSIGGDLPDDFDYFYQDPATRVMIGPKANEWGETIEVDPGDANRALRGEVNIYVWGKAEYADVFGGGRHTTFCYRIEFSNRDRDIAVRFVPYGDYNKTELDDG